MWVSRKVYSSSSTSANTATGCLSLPSQLPSQPSAATSTNSDRARVVTSAWPVPPEGYITACTYASIPLVDPATGARDPAPAHWSAAGRHPIPADAENNGSVSGGGAASGECHLFEFFVVGFSSGEVMLLDVSGGAATGILLGSLGADNEIVAVDVCGSLVAAAGSGGSVGLWFSYPTAGAPVATWSVQHGGCGAHGGEQRADGALASLRLWEGAAAWAGCDAEASAVYALCGTTNGSVLVYRVDVCGAENHRQSVALHSVLAVSISGTQGIAACAGDASAAGLRTSTDTSPVAACAVVGDRWIIGGLERRWACWDIQRLPLWSAVPGSEETAADTVLRLTGQGCGALSAERLRGASVFVRHSPTALKALLQATSSNDTSSAAAASTPPSSAVALTPWREKHAVVCAGAELGVLMAASSSPCGASGGSVWQVIFPSLQKAVSWPSSAFTLVNTQALVARADTVGRVMAVVALSDTRFATGGTDGAVTVWDWDADSSLFKPLHSLGGASHTDMVRALAPLRPPDVFLSASLDGTVREWHVFDLPTPLLSCRATTLARPLDAAAGNPHHTAQTTAGDYGPVTLTAFHQCGFSVTHLFHRDVRTYARLPVHTCEAPPSLVFDGERTVPVPAALLVEEARGDRCAIQQQRR